MNINQADFLALMEDVAIMNTPAIVFDEDCPFPLEFSVSLNEDEELLDVLVDFEFDKDHFKISCVRINYPGFGEIEWFTNRAPMYHMLEHDDCKVILLTYAKWVKEFICIDHTHDKPYVYLDSDEDSFYPVLA